MAGHERPQELGPPAIAHRVLDAALVWIPCPVRGVAIVPRAVPLATLARHEVWGAGCAWTGQAPAGPAGAAPACDDLILAFAQLCRMLARPFALAEIRAAAPADEGALAVGGILLAAERLGFKARALKPSRQNLAGAPPPFLVAGRVPGEAWLATGRVQDHLVLLEPSSGRTTACGLEAVGDLAERIVLVKPLAEPAQRRPAGATPCSRGCARCCGSSGSRRW